MTHELAEALVACLQADDFECELYENYSGKGMMNRLTTGIQGKITIDNVLSSVIAHAELLVSDGESMFVSEELRQDSLGKEYIIY
jgi:hypothetical protein